MRRTSKEQFFLDVAERVGAQSTCSRLQVGAVLTDAHGEQLWIGYNGGPRGGTNECRRPLAEGNCGCVHAESNAVVKAPGGIDKVAYLTHSPCPLCAVMLVNAHVVELHYTEEYRDPEGLLVLEEAGVKVTGHHWVMPQQVHHQGWSGASGRSRGR